MRLTISRTEGIALFISFILFLFLGEFYSWFVALVLSIVILILVWKGFSSIQLSVLFVIIFGIVLSTTIITIVYFSGMLVLTLGEVINAFAFSLVVLGIFALDDYIADNLVFQDDAIQKLFRILIFAALFLFICTLANLKLMVIY